jgi:hypothetical protein
MNQGKPDKYIILEGKHIQVATASSYSSLEHNGSGDSHILIGNMQHYSTVCRHGNGD